VPQMRSQFAHLCPDHIRHPVPHVEAAQMWRRKKDASAVASATRSTKRGDARLGSDLAFIRRAVRESLQSNLNCTQAKESRS
jgi:ribosomal protein L44E